MCTPAQYARTCTCTCMYVPNKSLGKHCNKFSMNEHQMITKFYAMGSHTFKGAAT